MTRKNVNTMTYEEAVRAWYDAAEKHADAGASDTEPRGVFGDILEALARDVGDPRVDQLVPQEHGDANFMALTWQLYGNSYFASRELTRQAERVVKVARRADVPQVEVAASYEYRYGRI